MHGGPGDSRRSNWVFPATMGQKCATSIALSSSMVPRLVDKPYGSALSSLEPKFSRGPGLDNCP